MMTSNGLTAEQLFLDFLASNGHSLDGEINCDPSSFHYFKCPHGQSTDARYKFYDDGIPSGYFKCWRCGIESDFCSKQQQEVTHQEWHAHTERLVAYKRHNEIETQRKHAEVAALAMSVFAMADPDKATEHSYLGLKHVKNYGLRLVTNVDENTQATNCYKGTLLVPCYDADNNLVNLERIYFDKKEEKFKKRPLTGGQRSGAYYLIGELTAQQDMILVAEGYSSGATAFEATGHPTAVTFNCGNIINVVKILRSKYPRTQIVIITDDDRWHADPLLRDSGLKSAQKTCANVREATYLLPDFGVLGLSDEKLQELKPTDINDLFVHLMANGLNRDAALDTVRHQINSSEAIMSQLEPDRFETTKKPSVTLDQSTQEPIPHEEILANLLERMTTIDFRQLADVKEGEKLKNKHFQIIAIEQILEVSKSRNWGICKNLEFIYLYNGEYWSLVDDDKLKMFLGSASEIMGVDKFNARYFNFKDQLYKQFMAAANLPKPEQQRDTVLINLKNGTFEVTPDGTNLQKFNHSDFMTYQLPFEYNPKANAPIFMDYLNKVLPDRELQNILSEYLGYVFIRPSRLKLEKTLLLYGTGANGKSVFYEIVRSLLGEENTSEYSLQDLTDSSGYSRAMIANKLVNYASEINGKLEASVFKQLVSGEPVGARLPYGRPFILTQYAKLIFNCNELPKDVEQTEAYFRRFLIIPFEITIQEAEQDKQLAQKIIASELSGVFNWVLQGLNRLLEQKKFTECELVKRTREQYERESDSVKMFLDEDGYKPHTTEYITIKLIYPLYRAFCQDGGFSPVNKLNFMKRLENTKVIVIKRNVGKVAYLTQSIGEYKKYS